MSDVTLGHVNGVAFSLFSAALFCCAYLVLMASTLRSMNERTRLMSSIETEIQELELRLAALKRETLKHSRSATKSSSKDPAHDHLLSSYQRSQVQERILTFLLTNLTSNLYSGRG
jgi:hypothetical protein